ncbi:unnamed protein product [Diabrotica balteata]|uniref:Uncharacterized protein n=1 Tax=Diabrotica balteata TaxID=107213 RepID=A0A9N9TB83_DIABA|nr:unnamed protein product [Diabrotica balteata]
MSPTVGKYYKSQTGFTIGIKYVKAFPCKKPKQTLLLVFLLILSLTTISAILIWRNPTRIIQIDQNKDNEEEDKNEPIDYTADTNAAPKDKLRIVTRINWVAKPPSGPIDNLTLPVSLVVIQHTATESCNSQASCAYQAHTIQTFHMESRNWSDVGYNFMIGGDGAVYEGRSWTKVGAHTLGVNDKSIGIAFIGTFTDHVPAALMLNAFHNLVNKGVHDGYITKDYKVMGARQFSGTESPGKAFYDIIKTWVHWSEKL